MPLPPKGSQRVPPILPGSEATVGEAECLPAGRAERVGSWKPSLVLRRRLGCVLPFRGIKQVSLFRRHGLPSRQLSTFFAFSSKCHLPQPYAATGQQRAAPPEEIQPTEFLSRPTITKDFQGQAHPIGMGSGHPFAAHILASPCI